MHKYEDLSPKELETFKANAIAEFNAFLEANKGKIFFPEKYLASQEPVIRRKARIYKATAPNGGTLWGFTRYYMDGMPDDLQDAYVLKEITRMIIETWEANEAEIRETRPAAALSETEPVFA